MCTPTVYPCEHFNVADDSEALRAAIKDSRTDTIIEILTTRNNCQRQQMANYFSEVLERDLIEDLKSELGSNFEDVIIALVSPPDEYLCRQLHEALSRAGTDEYTLIEIICYTKNGELHQLVETYERMYNRPLAEQMCSETSSNLRRLLTLIITEGRSDSHHVDVERAREQAEELFNAGKGTLRTKESTFTKILAHENFEQLSQIFEEYENVSGITIVEALYRDIDDAEYLRALLTIFECVQSRPVNFAVALYSAMIGFGTDDKTLIRIIVSRSEIDLGTIKKEFEQDYSRTLESIISEETSVDYKHVLLALVR